jgi:hypothetical protein
MLGLYLNNLNVQEINEIYDAHEAIEAGPGPPPEDDETNMEGNIAIPLFEEIFIFDLREDDVAAK